MYRVTFSHISASEGFAIRPNVSYLMEGGALRIVKGTIRDISEWSNRHCFDPQGNWNRKQVLLIRNGAFGDLIMLTPLLGELKERWSQIHLVVCCGARYREVLTGNSDVSSIIDYPVRSDDILSYDAVVEFEETDVYKRFAHRMNMIDLYGAVAGLEIRKPTPKICIPEVEIAEAAHTMPRIAGVKRIGIQAFASNRIRTYPAPLLAETIISLLKLGHEVVLFGLIEAEIPPNDRLHILPINESGAGFMARAAMLQTCDLCIAPDSAYSHVAGALGIPAIVCYGPIPSRLRSSYYSSVKAIDGFAPCAPCFHHTRGGDEFPAYGPCQTTRRCEALAQISPEIIVKAAQAALAEIGDV